MPDSPISVAFDMTFANRNQSGSGAYARSLLAAVQARDDVQPLVIAAPPKSGLQGTLRWLAWDAGNRVRSSRASLVHCPAFVAPWNLSVPFVMSVLDISTRRFPHDHPLEWRVYERGLLPGRARAAALVIAISEVTRRDVIAEYRVRPEKVVTIHPGIDHEFFAPTPAQTTPGPPRLLFPGAPVARKNLELVLRCLAAAPAGSATANAVLEISGADKEPFPGHRALITSLGLTERVKWLGQLPRDRMPALMASATAVVYPSFYEGFGFPPLEAMAAGIPVIASNASCLPEVLDHAAILVDPTDGRAFAEGLEALLSQPEVRARLVDAGRKRAGMFTWQRCAEQTLEAYRQALQVAA